MFRPAALALVTFWLGVLAASWVAATVSFRSVDRVMGPAQRPELAERLGPVPVEQRRVVLRHLASEINRWVFRYWGLTQLGLAAVLLGLAWPGGGRGRLLAIAVAAVVVIQTVGVGPRILDLGRAVDFVARPLPEDQGRTFGLLHGAYVILDLVKAALLAVIAWFAARP